MAKFIHTVPAGGSLFGAAPGTIFGVAQVGADLTAADFDSAALAAAGVGFAQVPDEAEITNWSVLATPLAAGAGNAAFTSQSEIEAGMLFPPVAGVIYKGTAWETQDGLSGGVVDGVSIVSGGTDYVTGTDYETIFRTTTDSIIEGKGLKVDVTSVSASGEITGVSVAEGGFGYTVGSRVNVNFGNINGTLEVTSLYAPVIGTINTGRGGGLGPNDMAPSYFPTLPLGYTAEEIYLVAPATGAEMYYDSSLPAPFTHDSFGNVFDGVDFTVELWKLGDSEKFAEITCPNQNPNVDVDFTRYVA